jgi:hypothetical protein
MLKRLFSRAPRIERSRVHVVPILGMHRSGTSMLARALNLMGLELGRPLLDAGPDNPRGYWENRFFLDLDIELLKSWGMRGDGFDDIARLEETAAKASAAADGGRLVARVDRYLRAEMDAAVWGWKDPRSVLTYPFWERSLHALGYRDVRPVIIVRAPLASARSLARRGDLAEAARASGRAEEAIALDLWSHYNRRLLALAEAGGCFVGLHDLLLDPRTCEAELARCAAFIGLPTDGMRAAIDWIDPNLVHHQAGETAVEGEAEEVYRKLAAIARRQQERSTSRETLGADIDP